MTRSAAHGLQKKKCTQAEKKCTRAAALALFSKQLALQPACVFFSAPCIFFFCSQYLTNRTHQPVPSERKRFSCFFFFFRFCFLRPQCPALEPAPDRGYFDRFCLRHPLLQTELLNTSTSTSSPMQSFAGLAKTSRTFLSSALLCCGSPNMRLLNFQVAGHHFSTMQPEQSPFSTSTSWRASLTSVRPLTECHIQSYWKSSTAGQGQSVCLRLAELTCWRPS